MTTTIEPTEEQKQAAAKWLEDNDKCPPTETEAWDLAHLLAEREHALLALVQHAQMSSMARAADLDAARAELRCERAEVEHFRKRLGETDAEACEARADLDAARARIAELEAANGLDESAHLARIAELYRDNTAHLAHIKALKGALVEALEDLDRADDNSSKYGDGVDTTETRRTLKAAISATAHYDVEGAVAGNPVTESPDCPRESHECVTVGFHAVDECERRSSSFPAECPKCQEGTRPFFDIAQNRWLCDRCHHPAGEPFAHVDVEGGEG
jgi:hypothetical protein